MRQVVDATDIEDIYTEEAEEEAIEMVTTPAAAEVPTAGDQPSPDADSPPPAET